MSQNRIKAKAHGATTEWTIGAGQSSQDGAGARETMMSAGKSPSQPEKEPSPTERPAPDEAAKIGGGGGGEMTDTDLDAVAGGATLVAAPRNGRSDPVTPGG